MVLQQYTVAQAEAKAHRDLSHLPVDEVMAGLHRRCLSGTLTVVTSKRTVHFVVEHGQFMSATSSRLADRLGLQLVDTGAIDLPSLYAALIWQHQQRLVTQVSGDPLPKLGEVLCILGHLSSEAIAEALSGHALAVYKCLDREDIRKLIYHPPGSRSATRRDE